MNELIRFSNAGGVVTVSINVSTHLPWDYVYTEENYPFSYRANSGSANPMPHEYALGFPNQMNFDFNSWDVSFFVPGAGHNYSIEIKWMQDGNELHNWKKDGTTDENTSNVLTFRGGARFLGQ